MLSSAAPRDVLCCFATRAAIIIIRQLTLYILRIETVASLFICAGLCAVLSDIRDGFCVFFLADSQHLTDLSRHSSQWHAIHETYFALQLPTIVVKVTEYIL